MRIYQKSCNIRYKTCENVVIWAILYDFWHNAFLPRNSKWEYTRNRAVYAIKHIEIRYLRAVNDDFRHNSFLLKNHKMKKRRNHQLCVEIWPETPKYHIKSMLLAFCIYFMKTWFVISRKLLTILDFFCNRAQVRFRRAPCDFSKIPEM